MFDITPDPRGFHHIHIKGRIEEAQMRDGLDRFLAALPETGQRDFLYTIEDFEFPALAAIAVEFGYFPRLFSALPKIGKVAVVADADWLRRAAEVEGMLIPGMDIRTFSPGQGDAAVAWLVEDDHENEPI